MTINKEIELPEKADKKINVAEVFNIDSKLSVKGLKINLTGCQILMILMCLIKIQPCSFSRL